MTKHAKTGIFFIDMRITQQRVLSQLCMLFCFISLASCRSNKEELPVIPPVTAPLTSIYIGYGVITDSFTHVNEDPSDNSSSLGYLRRGTVVQVVRRQLIKTAEGYITWVFVDGEQQGWLKEDVVTIYGNENQAKTASESMPK